MGLEEKLCFLRKKCGLSQLEVAEALDVSRQAVSRWEVGAVVPTVDNLLGLSRLYGPPRGAGARGALPCVRFSPGAGRRCRGWIWTAPADRPDPGRDKQLTLR